MNPRRVGVVGLGYVGLPTAVRLAAGRSHTIGIDVNQELVEHLRRGETPLLEEWRGKSIGAWITELSGEGLLEFSAEPGRALRGCSDAVLNVGIPVENGGLVFGPFREALEVALAALPEEALLLVRATVPAGTMQELVLPLVAGAGRRVGEDFFLAYSPERMAEGRALEEVAGLPAVLAAPDPRSLSRAENLLATMGVSQFVLAKNMRLAELVKAAENAYRDATIALVNEFATLCRALGLESTQLVRLANTHPRVRMPMPGPGVGGHCLPNAFHYLKFAAEPLDVPLPLLAQARAVNDQVPDEIALLVSAGLKRAGKSLAGAKVAVLGLAMKSFCDDDRLSPAYPLIAALETGGARVAAFDPVVRRKLPVQVGSEEEAVAESDAIVVLAEQVGIGLDPAYLTGLMRPGPVIVDTRDCVDRIKARALGCVLISV